MLNWLPIKSYFVSFRELLNDFTKFIVVNNTKNDMIEIYFHLSSYMLNLFNNAVKCLEANCITILDIYQIIVN